MRQILLTALLTILIGAIFYSIGIERFMDRILLAALWLGGFIGIPLWIAGISRDSDNVPRLPLFILFSSFATYMVVLILGGFAAVHEALFSVIWNAEWQVFSTAETALYLVLVCCGMVVVGLEKKSRTEHGKLLAEVQEREKINQRSGKKQTLKWSTFTGLRWSTPEEKAAILGKLKLSIYASFSIAMLYISLNFIGLINAPYTIGMFLGSVLGLFYFRMIIVIGILSGYSAWQDELSERICLVVAEVRPAVIEAETITGYALSILQFTVDLTLFIFRNSEIIPVALDALAADSWNDTDWKGTLNIATFIVTFFRFVGCGAP